MPARPLPALACLAALAGLPQMATAETRCATQADLAQGIVVSYAHGGHDTFTADPRRPGAVVLQGEMGGMSLGTTVLGQGYIYLSAVGPGNLDVSYDFGILPADLPRPVPGGTWEGVATVTANGTTSTERQIHRYGATGTLSEVTIAWPAEEERLYWFPDLGISVRAGDAVTAITPLALMP